MRRRLLVASGLTLAAAGLAASGGAASLYLYDHGRATTIAKGVTVAGVDVGGLEVPAARARVESELGARLRRSVTLVTDRHEFTVRPAAAGLQVDVARMIDDALAASRRGSLWHRAIRDLRGRPVAAAIPLRAALSQAHVETVVDHVASVLDRPAKNAQVVPKPAATGLKLLPEQVGVAVKRPLLEQRLTKALLATDGARRVEVPTKPVHPRWTLRNLPHKFGTYLLVSRETYTLRLYKQLKLVKTYGIAVGQAGLETPAGLYEINDKQVDPWWHVPNSAWAGDLAGRVIPPGPADPIKARWMGFFNGAGIHGTTEDWSIGHAASHGCIRMHIWDVEDLYPRVPLHTPIYVD
jgi:lipoprotein-anchoring transpeptidase ErfK/SrfK